MTVHVSGEGVLGFCERTQSTVSPLLPVDDREPILADSCGSKPAQHIVSAVTTAPRLVATLDDTLSSLLNAGFTPTIFAEPETKRLNYEPWVQNATTLGSFGNFMTALSAIYHANPHADGYVVFEDDLEAMTDLKNWLANQLWQNAPGGVVSLYTCSAYERHERGWQTLHHGYYRTWGGLAYMFERNALVDFLTNKKVMQHRQTAEGWRARDAVVGRWSREAGRGIAYHCPSLVQHTGETSTVWEPRAMQPMRCAASFAQTPSDIGISAGQRPSKIGLVGYNTATGLGSLSRDIARHLPITRWLVPKHPDYGDAHFDDATPQWHAKLDQPIGDLHEFLTGLDWVIFCELPYWNDLPGYARELGVRVACVPMWEWLYPELDWLRYVDLMLCPNRRAFAMLEEWKEVYKFEWDQQCIPWPIDTERFRFRQRDRCDSFLFINGSGVKRRGIDIIDRVSRLVPEAQFVVRSQTTNLPKFLPNVEVLGPVDDQNDLYNRGDVCIQPSRFDGIGLALLECQACGIPLVTTGDSPMYEYKPMRLIRQTPTKYRCFGPHDIVISEPDPDDLAKTIRTLIGKDIAGDSQNARQFIEQTHSWQAARPAIMDAIGSVWNVDSRGIEH